MSWETALDRQIHDYLPDLKWAADEPMAKHTSFRIGGPAKRMAFPKTREQLVVLMGFLQDAGVKPLLIGNGTNLLVADKGLDTVVIDTSAELSHIELTDEGEIAADAGVSLSKLALFAWKNGLTGLEFAHGIPGTLGGGVVMNAGAYGGELKDVVTEVTALYPDGVKVLTPAELDFSYRHSVFSAGEGIVLGAKVKLESGDPDAIKAKMDDLRVADALTEIFTIFKRCNKYIDETEPWVLAKDEAKADRLSTVLYNLVESIVIGASMLEPYMPETAEKIAKQLNTELRDFDTLEQFGLYESGKKVTDQPEILFARLDMKEVAKKEEELEAEMAARAKKAEEEEKAEEGIDIEAKPEISYEDFSKLQFQVGEIIACEAVPKSKKLLCSQVKIGSQVKQIVSGIKAHYTPEEMVGKKVMVLVNLKPAKLAGVLSEGMLLCAEDAEGNLALVSPEKPMPAGAEIC